MGFHAFAMEARIRQPSAFGHIGVTVPDLDRAMAWYRDVLGLEVLMGPIEIQADVSDAGRNAQDVFGPGFSRMRQAHLTTSNGIGIELFQFDVPRTRSSDAARFEYRKTGVFHFCVVDRDIDGLVARIEANDGRVRTRPVRDAFPGEPYRWCYCEDPFGNVVEVYSHSHEQVYANRRGPTARA